MRSSRKFKARKGEPPALLWVTDPWETLDHSRDTSLRLIEEGTQSRPDILQYWCDLKSVRLEENDIRVDAKCVLSVKSGRGKDSFQWGPIEAKPVSDFFSIQYRPDPPVDQAYLHPLHLLVVALKKNSNTQVTNPLEVLLCRNEKLEANAIPGLMPPSLISCEWEKLFQFGRKLGRTVLKPLHEAQSHGVELLDWRKKDACEDAKIKLMHATHQFQVPVLLQTYLEGIAEGETRLWFLDGKLLAHAQKQPMSGDFRVNIDRGSRLASVPLTKREKDRIPKIARHLREHKIRLAAVDLIEGWLTDFNFTSPGLITQMEDLLGENLAKPLVKALFHPG